MREATEADAPAAAAAIGELLVELSGGGPPPEELEAASAELVRDRGMGALLVAEAGGEDGIVGVLAASWQHAIHVPGRYGTIQDLWVHPRVAQPCGRPRAGRGLLRDRSRGRAPSGSKSACRARTSSASTRPPPSTAPTASSTLARACGGSFERASCCWSSSAPAGARTRRPLDPRRRAHPARGR